jgi:hypothetical protein
VGRTTPIYQTLTKVITHTRSDSEHRTEAQEELAGCYEAIFTAQELLRQHIRAELRFEHPSIPRIEYEAPEGFFGAITRIKAYLPEQPRYPIKYPPRVIKYKDEGRGGEFILQL